MSSGSGEAGGTPDLDEQPKKTTGGHACSKL